MSASFSYINATDARQLLKTGISDEESMAEALTRTGAAIADTARKGGANVEVTVMRLSDEMIDRLKADLIERGFVVLSHRKLGGSARAIAISWE